MSGEIPPTPLYERRARREVYPLLGNQIGQPGYDVFGQQAGRLLPAFLVLQLIEHHGNDVTEATHVVVKGTYLVGHRLG